MSGSAEVIGFPARPIQEGALDVELCLPLAVGAEKLGVVSIDWLDEADQPDSGPKGFAEVIPISSHPNFSPVGLATEQSEANDSPEYASSLRALRYLGETALFGSLEARLADNQAQQEFESSVAEMLKSDDQFGEALEIVRRDDYRVVDGRAIGFDGATPVVDLVANGVEASKKASEEDSNMKTQYRRDEADLRNANKVDEMLGDTTRPNTIIVTSLEPKEAMTRDGAEYWESLNYKEGVAYMQVYHRNNDGSLSTWTLSVDKSDKQAWRRLWMEQGVGIPGDEVTDNWVDYSLEFDIDDTEVEERTTELRTKYYQSVSADRQQRKSVNQHMEDNEEIINQVYQGLYTPLAHALVDGRNRPDLQEFAGASVNSPKLKAELRQELRKIAHSEGLTSDDVTLLEGLIRYSLTEELRERLKQSSEPNNAQAESMPLPSVFVSSTEYQQQASAHYVQSAPQPSIAIMMGGNVQRGSEGGRKYGSCGSKIDVNEGSIDGGPDLGISSGPQSVFGGKAEKEVTKPEEDQFGPLTFECPNGHENTRPRGELIDKCTTCDASVSC